MLTASPHTTTLTAPTGLRSEDGTGHVFLTWKPVPGAHDYLVHRSVFAEGPYEPLPGGPLPHPPYADTRAEPGHGYWYKVAARDDRGVGPLTSTPVPGCVMARGIALATVTVTVDAAGTTPPQLTGDGAHALVRSVAGPTDDGDHVRVAIWNSATDRTTSPAGSPALDRTVVVRVTGLAPSASYTAALHGADTAPADAKAAYRALGASLRHSPLPPLPTAPDGTASLTLDVPLPGLLSLHLFRV
ncbi:fibronectin type III domain-containing protein [Streptomyces longispororuber]|uniref:fibronectin type III domain-containing protein n=1 Tax=Streptomyces longispororuber TaxID=68230 RepID=UPI00210C5BF1|nr:fibronectin type III domain-containing protein [Streptomyces longispororuber]MCQ4207580.1 fibronectin type III domain-containing protein [Streptomyces longispororuber]